MIAQRAQPARAIAISHRELPPRGLPTALLVLVALLGPWAPAPQASFPARTAVDYTFGQRIRFILEPETPASVREVILYYTLPGMDVPYRIPLPPDASTSSQIVYERDLRRDPLPPFVPITFWWEVQDRDGQWWSTERQTFRYSDNRVAWQVLEEDPFRLYWHAGDPGLARAALTLARQSLDRIGRPLGYQPPAPIDLFWYADPDLARAAFRLAGIEIGGEVLPRWRAVILIAPADGAGLDLLRRLIPHELTHVMLDDLAGGQPRPAWLEEGWAMVNEGPPEPEWVRILQEPRLEGISLAGLCGEFPTDPLRARQAYALSWAAVRYIQEQEGNGGLLRLLNAYAGGASCEGSVRQVLGRSLDRLAREAEAALRPKPLWQAALEGLGPWLVLFALLSLGPLSLLLGGPSGRRTAGEAPS